MVNFIFINDLHFGIQDTERELAELRKNFIPFVKENDVDVIFLGGDYFDHKLSLGEPFSIMALEFFKDLVEVCAEKNIKLRCIEGTQSHDRFQPRILENCIPENTSIDYKYFETVGTETLLGMNILYVPEEYPLNVNEYYAEYKTQKFDLMLVHGTWDFIGFGGEEDNERNDINTAPIFVYSEWKDALENGLSICGHIHGRHGYTVPEGTKIIYPGSFTAWSFDQISPRGFLYGQFDIDKEKDRVTYKFINNPDAPTYANLDIKSLELDLENTSLDVIKEKIQEMSGKVDHLKVNLDALSAEKILILKGLYSDSKNIHIDNKPKKKVVEKTQSDKFVKFAYLLNDKLSTADAVQRYVKEEFGVEMKKEDIEEIIKK